MQLRFLAMLTVIASLYVILAILYTKTKRERKARLIVVSISFLSFCLVSFLDGWFTIPVFEQGAGWHKLEYWVVSLAISMIMISSLGFIYLRKDKFFSSILIAQPWILLWGGLLDAISVSVQMYTRGLDLFIWLDDDYIFWWLDANNTKGFPLLPYLISKHLGHAQTTGIGVLIGAIISTSFVFALWSFHYYIRMHRKTKKRKRR